MPLQVLQAQSEREDVQISSHSHVAGDQYHRNSKVAPIRQRRNQILASSKPAKEIERAQSVHCNQSGKRGRDRIKCR